MHLKQHLRVPKYLVPDRCSRLVGIETVIMVYLARRKQNGS